MTGRTVDLVLGVPLGGHLRRVGHAKEDAAGGLEALDGNGVARRLEVLVEQRTVGDGSALHPGRVLHRVGNPEKGAVEALLAPFVDGIGGGTRLGGIEVDYGGELLVPRVDAGDGHFGHVARLRLAPAHGGGDGGGTLIQQLGHVFFLICPFLA